MVKDKSECVTLGNLGEMYKKFGEYQQAIEHYQRAVQIAEEIGLKKSIGINLGKYWRFVHSDGSLG